MSASYDDFRAAVNLTPRALEDWLQTEDSQAVGQKQDDGDESVGHETGRRIVTLLRTKKADLTEDDERVMAKVVGYVHRHLAQRPDKEDIASSRWRYSLMNWGHDPLKD